nr:MAG TPA: hypothetical protein [Caudoviricetes sp.]
MPLFRTGTLFRNLTDGRRLPPIKHRRTVVERHRTAFGRYPTLPIKKGSNVVLRPFYGNLRLNLKKE